MPIRALASLAVCLAVAALPVTAQDPLSAIDWLERQTPLPSTPQLRAPAEPPVADSAGIPSVTVTALDAPRADAVGLLPSSVTGFPATLWQASRSDTLAGLIAAQRVEDQPAMQALLYSLLLAEADPPADADQEARVLGARIDRLIALGAVDPAEALVERAGPMRPALFARWFKLSLLSGDIAPACEALNQAAHLAPGYAERIYCRARGGDWGTAATTLETAALLGALTPQMADLLARFLDPDLAESTPSLPPAAQPSALEFRLREAIGEPLPASALPRAFAATALDGNAGWKAQLEAAERLTRSGAISENRLLGIYGLRLPAASGGVWDRVEAVQRFETALNARDPQALARSLPPAWAQMREAGLDVAFARLFGEALLDIPLSGEAATIALTMQLLSPVYEAAANGDAPDDARTAFLLSLARGAPDAAIAPGARARAVAAAFDGATELPEAIAHQLDEGRLGEVILRAIVLYGSGIEGDMPDLTGALATFRAVGLEDTARRAALQALLRGPAQ
jgi:hypothetical protein